MGHLNFEIPPHETLHVTGVHLPPEAHVSVLTLRESKGVGSRGVRHSIGTLSDLIDQRRTTSTILTTMYLQEVL